MNSFIFALQQNTTLPEALVYNFTLQLLAIVSDMHEGGILHADIKPDNIMLRVPSTPVVHSPDHWTVHWTVQHVLFGQFVLDHKLGEISDGFAGRRHFNDVAEELIGLPLRPFDGLELVAQS